MMSWLLVKLAWDGLVLLVQLALIVVLLGWALQPRPSRGLRPVRPAPRPRGPIANPDHDRGRRNGTLGG